MDVEQHVAGAGLARFGGGDPAPAVLRDQGIEIGALQADVHQAEGFGGTVAAVELDKLPVVHLHVRSRRAFVVAELEGLLPAEGAVEFARLRDVGDAKGHVGNAVEGESGPSCVCGQERSGRAQHEKDE